MPAPTATIPIIAPLAPQAYDKRDEDRWRQLVEQALRDLAASTNPNLGETVNVDELRRVVEFRSRPRGVNDGDTVLAAEMIGYNRGAGVGEGTLNTQVWYAGTGTTDSYTYKRDADDRHAFMIKPGTTEAATDSRQMFFRPHTLSLSLPDRIEFRESYGPIVGGTPSNVALHSWMSTSIQAWLRKETSAGDTSSRFTFGFSDFTLIYPSKLVPRIGILGDGAGGFRFGSVNCPDGSATGDNADTDIDANSVQPSALVAPGENWFHVRIKMVPPTPTQSGRWGAYLNGALVATLTTNTNFPRGSQATNRHYGNIQPSLLFFPRTTQLGGVLVDDLRVTFDEVYAL